MSNLKYQEDFARDLTNSFIVGNTSHVQITIRHLKNKAQAAYISAAVAIELWKIAGRPKAVEFLSLMHPNN